MNTFGDIKKTVSNIIIRHSGIDQESEELEKSDSTVCIELVKLSIDEAIGIHILSKISKHTLMTLS